MAFIALSNVNTVSADQSVIYVNDLGGNDSWDGQSAAWVVDTISGPKKSIKNATGTVNRGGTVNIADGIYKGENNTNITIDKDMTITGQSRDGTIINGSDSAQIFQIETGLNVTIANLTLANGNATYGGAIVNYANSTAENKLNVKNCIFTCNNATYGSSILNYGNLNLENSTFVNNHVGESGTILNLGYLTVDGSNFTFNTADSDSGAIFNQGTLNIKNSKFSSNNAGCVGGAILNAGNLTVNGSDFTDNNAFSGGAIFNAGNLELNSSNFIENAANGVDNTLVYGGGAIFSYGNLTVNNCTFTNNTATYGGAIYNDGGTSNTPVTIMKSDFRGNGANWNGGAVYNDGNLILTDTTLSDNRIINNASIGDMTYIPSGGAVYNAGNLTGVNSTFTNNTAGWYGGAILSTGNLTVTGSTFTNNGVTLQEGGISNSNFFPSGGAINNLFNGYLNVFNSTFTNNTAFYGGAIYNRGLLTVMGSTFNKNTGSGGAIFNNGGDSNTPAAILNSTFTANNGKNYSGGGAIFNFENSNLNVVNCIFTNNNVSNGMGGAIYNQGTLNVDNGQFSGNIVTDGGYGGAIYNNQGSNLRVTGSTFTNNVAGIGGAIYNKNTLTSVTVLGNVFVNNTAGHGGAIHNLGNLTVTNNSFLNNTANQGGAIYDEGTGCTIEGNDITGNNGIAIYTTDASTQIHFNRIIKNNGSYDIWGVSGVNATNNWWGTNFQGNSPITSGRINDNINASTWLILSSNASSTSATDILAIIVDLRHDNNRIYHDPINGHVIDGIPVSFTATNGNLSINSTTLINGQAATLLTVNTSGNPNITATVDKQTVSTAPINVAVDNSRNFAGGSVTLTSHVTDYYKQPVNGGTINFTVNGIGVGTVSVNNGTATINWQIPSSWTVGDYTILAEYMGTDGSGISQGNGSLTVLDKRAIIYVNTVGNDVWDGLSDIYNATTGSGPKATIKNAVGTVADNGTIYVAPGIYNEHGIMINTNLTIVGINQYNTIINGTQSGSIFIIAPNVNVNMINLTLTGGNDTMGGAIYNNGTLTIKNSTFTGNNAAEGGAIFNNGANLKVTGSTFRGNRAQNNGGAIYNYYGTLKLDNTTFTNNSAYTGGALRNYDGTLDATSCSFAGNNATTGGALWNYGGTLDVTDSTLTGNNATESGGAIWNIVGTLDVRGNTITCNTAKNSGGAIWSYNANANSRVNFNSITGNSPNNSEIYSGYGTLDATLNWWGSNTNPSVYVGADVGKVNVAPWLILNVTASPTSIIRGNNSTVTADLKHDDNGIYHDPVVGHVPDGIPVSFTATNGNLSINSTTLINGQATTLFAANKVGTANINAKSDGQSVSTQVMVNPISTTVAVDPVQNIAGKNVTLRAHVNDCYGNPVNEGQVDFTVNGIPMNADVNGGIATLNWTIPSFWTVNSYDLSVKYIGTDEYVQSNGMGVLKVDPDPKVDFSIAGGIYNTDMSVALMINKAGTVYYTTDGSVPTTFSNVYKGAININETTTLRYMAVDTENNTSTIYTQTYIIDRTAPTASVNYKSGTYNKNLNIVLKMSKAGTIYYTTNGSTPTTSSKKYTGAFTISKNTTLKFMAVDKAGNKSSIYMVKYVIDKTGPYVKSMYPEKSSTGISRSNTLYLKFSENIKASINWSKVYIKNLKTGKKVAVNKSINGNVLYLKTGKRSSYTWYQIYVPAAAIKDAAGNNGTGYAWKFKTGRY